MPSIVKVKVNDENLGDVTCSPLAVYSYDKEVTLTTHSKGGDKKGWQNKFIGWKYNGEFLTNPDGSYVRDIPLTFKVDESNEGEYEAVYESGYKFYRLANKGTGRVICGVNDKGDVGDYSSLQLIDPENKWSDAGTVFQLNSYYVPGGYPHDFIVQGYNSGTKYQFDSPVIYVTMDQNLGYENKVNGETVWVPEDGTWNVHPNSNPTYMADDGGSNVETSPLFKSDITHWYVEQIDKDLETGENYFSLDPDTLVQVGDKYYTTLRTSWNILFDPAKLTVYTVTEVDETNGYFSMEPIAGNIIPKDTPVIVMTSTTDVKENRMIPTETAASSTPSTNLLTSSVKFFPSQTVSADDNLKGKTVKALRVNENGELSFGGDALTTVNGNEAYLVVDKEVKLIPTVTLAQLAENPVEGNAYIITDLASVENLGNTLYCKDDNKAINPSVMESGEVDYLKTYTSLQKTDWDQSNWIAVNLPEAPAQSLLNHKLNNVKGTLTDAQNLTLEATEMPTAGDEYDYDLNTYITCNFSSSHQAGITVQGALQNCFFVAPKQMEIARVTWAVWDSAKQMFIKPVGTGDKLEGEFYANFTMLDDDPKLVNGQGYQFPALIKRENVQSSTFRSVPARVQKAAAGTVSVVYPIDFDPERVMTEVETPQVASRRATARVYVNPLGVTSRVPFGGVNIIVTTYDDGTTLVTKEMH